MQCPDIQYQNNILHHQTYKHRFAGVIGNQYGSSGIHQCRDSWFESKYSQRGFTQIWKGQSEIVQDRVVQYFIDQMLVMLHQMGLESLVAISFLKNN